MSTNNLKNIVVLKNLPSNLIEEAIVVLKSKKIARKLELIEKNSSSGCSKNDNSNDYIIREAENVVYNYISKIENCKKIRNRDTNIETKYKKMKIYSIIISFVLIFCVSKIIFN